MTDDGTHIWVAVTGKGLMTPAKQELRVPTQALADAIEAEWAAHKKYVAAAMPLTALACTAIDRIAPQREAIIEALMAYVDTDTLSYRATNEALAARQTQEWDPVVSGMSKRFGGIWQTTAGIGSLAQPEAIHDGIRAWLAGLCAMRLSAVSVLASLFSSLVLAIAVAEGELDAGRAFALSRLEEEFQADRWGRDDEAHERSMKMQAETVAAARFLRLLAGTDNV